MSNQRYTNALERKIKNFKDDFKSFSRTQYTVDKKITHSGEFGATRENMCKQLIESIIPKSRAIDTRGFIINSKDEISKEQDIIIYSKNDTPVLTLENMKFFPIETVVAVGQIKSKIRTRKDLKDALINLQQIKLLRHNMGHDSVISRCQDRFDGRDGYSMDNVYDQVFTFLICESIDFTMSAEDVDNLYDTSTPNYLKHNMILDLNSGSYGYKINNDNILVGIPQTSSLIAKPFLQQMVKNDDYIKLFLTNLQIFVTSNTVYHPDMGHYIKI